jgi:tryptophan-rich sensory protein
MSTSAETPTMSAPLAAALAGSAFAVPLALSASSSPSPNHPATLLWYESLREPAFKPPDWVIPTAWAAIETALAAAAYRLLRARPSASRTKALALWSWNVFMIGAWGRLFFKRHALGLSTVAAASMVATSVGFVRAAAPVDKTAARAGIPLVAWLTFATALTGSIWYLNSRRRA